MTTSPSNPRPIHQRHVVNKKERLFNVTPNTIKKRSYKDAADIKTMADYALILQYVNGYEKKNAIESAMVSQEEPLFKKLLKRNIELFKTGDITMM